MILFPIRSANSTKLKFFIKNILAVSQVKILETLPPAPKGFWKSWLIFSIISLGFFAIVSRLVYIQIIKADEYRERARKQHESKVAIQAHRGSIYDRNMRLLASSQESISIAADPTVLEDPYPICAMLEKATGNSAELYLEKIKNAKGAFVWLERSLPLEVKAEFESYSQRGIIYYKEPRRRYVYGAIAGQALGCANVDNKGLSGIELSYDTLLSGKSGYMVMMRNARGQLIPAAGLPQIPAEDGKSLQLTLDIDLQRIIDFELQEGVVSTMAESGTAIAIAPATGEVLAISSYPSFNPNRMTLFNQDAMRIRAITDLYEPGSTFKMITAAIALEEGIYKKNSMVDGFGGKIQFGDATIIDDHEMGRVTFAQALEQSSNIVYGLTANKIESKKFYKYIRDFGFGIALGFDIFGESAGKLKKPKEFDPTTKLFMGFGYELLATPLQIANAYAAVANSGVMMQPHIVKSIIGKNGETISSFEPQKIRRIISKECADTLKNMLVGVVDNGTGSLAKIDGLKIAGKTGTSQQFTAGKYSKSDYNASFAGFFPSENPEVALLILLDKPRQSYYGGSTAAPIFKKIAQKYIYAKGLYQTKANEQNSVSSDSAVVPDLIGMKICDAKELIAFAGFKIVSENDNNIIGGQIPQPGTKLKYGDEIKVAINQNQAKFSTQRPNLIGKSLRRALAILHSDGYKAKIVGSGIVVGQYWQKNNQNEIECVLECKTK